MIAGAQDEDGYLDTYFTIKDREKRWTNLLEAHELYCAGHFFEAGKQFSKGDPYSMISPEIKPYKARAIPYYCWGNRGINQMRVWLPVMK